MSGSQPGSGGPLPAAYKVPGGVRQAFHLACGASRRLAFDSDDLSSFEARTVQGSPGPDASACSRSMAYRCLTSWLEASWWETKTEMKLLKLYKAYIYK